MLHDLLLLLANLHVVFNDTRCVTGSPFGVSATTLHTVLILWVKPSDIKNDTEKDACFFLLLSAPVETACFVSFWLFHVLCTPAHQLCSTTEPPGGSLKNSKHVTLTPSLSCGETQNHSIQVYSNCIRIELYSLLFFLFQTS